jgi:hypothetical protein
MSRETVTVTTGSEGSWIRRFLAAPVFEGDEDKTRVSNLLNIILLAFLALTLVMTVVIFVLVPFHDDFDIIG